MTLDQEIEGARKEIISDGYEMSFGEILNLYRDEEIFISPEFQRLFRWDEGRKTKFIESILLGLPLPPIFVYQRDDGVWELIDGLQRLSTIFQFVGVLKKTNGELYPPLTLEGTKFIPSLAGRKWGSDTEGDENNIGQAHQLQIKRSRIRVEILKQESDPLAKYELFQRLNTGGDNLSNQEVRNCVGYMVNPHFQEWLKGLSEYPHFLNTLSQTENAREKDIHTELALRFIVYRNFRYQSGLDVHEYLDEALIRVAASGDFEYEEEERVFKKTFYLLNEIMGSQAFKRWDGLNFTGKFLISVYEVIALGLSRKIDEIDGLPADEKEEVIREKCRLLWSNGTFNRYSGAGVRGTSRLANLLPMAERYFEV